MAVAAVRGGGDLHCCVEAVAVAIGRGTATYIDLLNEEPQEVARLLEERLKEQERSSTPAQSLEQPSMPAQQVEEEYDCPLIVALRKQADAVGNLRAES